MSKKDQHKELDKLVGDYLPDLHDMIDGINDEDQTPESMISELKKYYETLDSDVLNMMAHLSLSILDERNELPKDDESLLVRHSDHENGSPYQ